MKIVITDAGTVTIKNDVIDLDVFEKYGELTRFETTAPSQTAERIKDADIVLCNKTVLGREELEGSSVKYIGLFATGYNNIDTVYCREHGIVVCNAGQYSTKAVAQQVFAFILNHASSLDRYSALAAGGGWIKDKYFSAYGMPTHELFEKTLGIVGYGAIGREVAKIAGAFGMNVLVYTRTVKDDGANYVSLDDLLKNSDYISVNVPLTSETKEMFGEAEFEKCMDGAYFINTARGGVVNESALRKALESGKLSGAAVDVVTSEPMTADCVLFGAPNITVTPHIAWTPVETRQRLIGIVCGNIDAWLAGTPVNVVS